MTDRRPASDMLPEEREEHPISSASVARPASAGAATGGVATHEDPMQVASHDLELTYEHGVELEARSQWAYARMRFFRHKLAVTSLIILIGFGLIAIFAGSDRSLRGGRDPARRPHQQLEQGADVGRLAHLRHRSARPRLLQPRHLRRPDVTWRRARGGAASTVIGTAIGAAAGYYGGARRQRPHALHRPHPHAAGSRHPARRRPVLRPGRRQREPRRHDRHDPAADGDRPHPRVPLLDRHRAHRARVVPLVTREGVRGGGEGIRRRRPADHRAPHPPQLRRADHRQHDAHHRGGDPRGGGALVPRASASSRPSRRSESSSRTARRRASTRGGS